MPKTPILTRETFFSPVRSGQCGANPAACQIQKHLEWNLVTTELGEMVEPRQSHGNRFPSGPLVQLDVTDAAFTKVSTVEEEQFYVRYGSGGSQLDDYNT